MSNRLKSYLRAIEEGTVPKYHNYHDVQHGRMTVEDYIKKWGPYRGSRARLKHV